jgi:methionyl-tRNA synthetase
VVKVNKERKVLVTSALPYVNNIPHLGNLICVLSADVYTRFLRLKNVDVISVLGTDEHGTTSEVKALEEGITAKEVCDKYSKIHKEIYDWFLCDFDCFGRTSSAENREITQDIFLKLHKHGFILTESVKQAYCEHDERFLSDRFVEGTCPKCGYDCARGDQCEKCGTLLNPEELVDLKCKICKKRPVFKDSEHLFIDLPKLEPELKKWIEREKKTWSNNAVQMTDAWIRDGLKPRCITRDLKWGIPVPLEGFEKKVFYSWFDAPIGYISITAEKFPHYKKEWWQNEHVELVQFMGKDNIPFHTILFPSFLIGTRDPWILVRRLSVNEYLNYEGGQFSKSRGVGVFGDDAKATGIKPDIWRYYLLRNRPENNDSFFSWQEFMDKTNNELVANLGNLVNRTVFFINKFYDSVVPNKHSDEKQLEYIAEIQKIDALYEKIELRQALQEIMLLSKKGNQYFQENEPWKKINENKKQADNAIHNLARLVKDLSILIQPYLPQIAIHMQKQLNIGKQHWADLEKDIPTKHKIEKAEILIEKIEQKQVNESIARFEGKKQAMHMHEKNTKDKKNTGNTGNTENKDHDEKTLIAQNTEIETFSLLNLKVANVIDIKDHPDAEKLYILQIDLGSEQRQLVAGLRPYYKKEELLHKNLIIVTNLEPAKLRGIESQGMLLAADNGKDVGILTVESAPGAQVLIDGTKPGERMINYKEFSTVEITAKNGKAYAYGHVLKAGKHAIVVENENIVEGKVR